MAAKVKVCLNHMVIFMAENVSKVVADVFIREKIMQALWYLRYNVMPDMCEYISCALKNIYKRCCVYEFNIEIWENFFNFCIVCRK